jgi:hypothetical protein
MVHERSAHVLYFIDKARIERKRTPMIVDAFHLLVPMLVRSHTGKDMDIMSFSFQGGSQLGDVDPHSAHRDGVEGFPGEQGNPHS